VSSPFKPFHLYKSNNVWFIKWSANIRHYLETLPYVALFSSPIWQFVGLCVGVIDGKKVKSSVEGF
jgi:hypothetical protein